MQLTSAVRSQVEAEAQLDIMYKNDWPTSNKGIDMFLAKTVAKSLLDHDKALSKEKKLPERLHANGMFMRENEAGNSTQAIHARIPLLTSLPCVVVYRAYGDDSA